MPGNPGADGGLRYLGEDVEEYKRRFEIKTGDDPKDWKALITLCKVLNETPLDKLEEALKPILDIDGTLWFLAIDIALINGDGYWTRASDYNIYRDEKGKFHIIPHDTNETLQASMGFGPGGPGGPGFGAADPAGRASAVVDLAADKVEDKGDRVGRAADRVGQAVDQVDEVLLAGQGHRESRSIP